MIIDQISQKNNVIRFSFFDKLNQNILRPYYSTKDKIDFLSWRVERDLAYCYIDIMSNEISYLNEIDFELQETYGSFTIEYSLDFVNWFELPFFETQDGDILKYVYTIDEYPYYFNFSTNETSQFNDFKKYVFKKLNPISNLLEDLYTNFPFRFIRIKFYNINATELTPLKFLKFNLLINENFDETVSNENILSTRTSTFFKSKIFESQNFFPDQMKMFSKMLEDSNQKVYSSSLLQKSNIYIEEIKILDLNALKPIGIYMVGEDLIG